MPLVAVPLEGHGRRPESLGQPIRRQRANQPKVAALWSPGFLPQSHDVLPMLCASGRLSARILLPFGQQSSFVSAPKPLETPINAGLYASGGSSSSSSAATKDIVKLGQDAAARQTLPALASKALLEASLAGSTSSPVSPPAPQPQPQTQHVIRSLDRPRLPQLSTGLVGFNSYEVVAESPCFSQYDEDSDAADASPAAFDESEDKDSGTCEYAPVLCGIGPAARPERTFDPNGWERSMSSSPRLRVLQTTKGPVVPPLAFMPAAVFSAAGCALTGEAETDSPQLQRRAWVS